MLHLVALVVGRAKPGRGRGKKKKKKEYPEQSTRLKALRDDNYHLFPSVI
jgi:hypothetical protein